MKSMPMCEICAREYLGCEHSSVPRGPIVAFELSRQVMVNVCPPHFFSNLDRYMQCHYNLIEMEANMPSEIITKVLTNREIIDIILEDIDDGGKLYYAIKEIK